jgi:hypothetical protein
MAFAVWASLKTEGTTAIPDMATELKQTNVVTLPFWYSADVRPTAYSALNNKATTIAAWRWRIKRA